MGPLHLNIGLIATNCVVQDSEHQALDRVADIAPVRKKLFTQRAALSNG
jgi:hypothetical protein